MTETELRQFLTERKEYRGHFYFNAQLICLQAFKTVFQDGFSAGFSLSAERKSYYTRALLGAFIDDNPAGGYRLTPKAGEALALAEQTLKTDYGLTDGQVGIYRSFLMKERDRTERFHSDENLPLYHLTPVLSGTLDRIEPHDCEDALHLMGGSFCYVAPKSAVPLCLRSVDMKMYPYVNPRCVVVATHGKDFETACVPCCEYRIVRNESIRPVIMPWGAPPLEYVSPKVLEIDKSFAPKIQTPATLVDDGLKIYLINDDDFFRKTVSSSVIDEMSDDGRERCFDGFVQSGKMRLYTPFRS